MSGLYAIHDGFQPHRMTVAEYVDYIETGKRSWDWWLPLPEDARRAEEILVERGVISPPPWFKAATVPVRAEHEQAGT